MKSSYSININGIEIGWDTTKGICTFAGSPVSMMWVDSTLLGLMSSVQQMVGTERFILALQGEGRNSIDDDWQVIAAHEKFEDGFNALTTVAQVAGWGSWTLIEYNKDEKKCVFRIENGWEGQYQKTLGTSWGSGFVAGKLAGYCSRLFDTNCWPTQTSHIANGDAYDEFTVVPSTKTIEIEVDNLLLTDQATRADMDVALEKLRRETDERHRIEEARALFFKNLNRIDTAIQRAMDIEQMMSDVLQVTYDIMDLDRSWLLYPCDPDAPTMTVPMECTNPEYPAIKPGDEVPTLPNVPSVIRNALDANDVVAYDSTNPHPSPEVVSTYSVLAEMHMVLHPKIGKDWLFGVHQCSYSRIWTDEDINLFREIGHRLNDGLNSLLFLQDLQKSEQRFRTLLAASPVAVYETDAKGNCLYVNDNWQKLSGLSMEESLGDGWQKAIHEEDRDSIVQLWQEHMQSHEPWSMEYRFCKADGEVSWVMGKTSAIRDEQGQITGYLGANMDITERKRTDELLSYQASHDVLTRLNNRREFGRRAERLLSTIQQDKAEHALCFMDLDQFKVVNDTCGHTAGDEMLRQIAQALQETVRKRDTLARLGGDEFGVLMEHCTLEQANRLAESLQKRVHNYQFTWEEHVFRVSVSIGLVAITETTSNLTELMQQADAACYMAKDAGRNRIHVYHQEDAATANRHGEMRWVERLQRAFDNDQFCLYAQSIVPIDGSESKHYELLVRLIDEKGEIIPPGAFLPAAERYNLMTRLDRWVVNHTFLSLAANPAFCNQIDFCSINLSGQSLADEEFLNYVAEQLQDSGINGKKICFEITETAAISNIKCADKFIARLRQFGCTFALDDFGSGLSSFGYLKSLPVDYLKIDGMFVKDIVNDPIDHAMVKSINEIGQVMGMKTIAEFVENDEIKGMLREIGINYAQGYGIDKPMPFSELLERSNNVTDINTQK